MRLSNGYAPLTQSALRDPEAEEYLGECFSTSAQAPKANWVFVGEGNGKYVQADRYTYVGQGAGEYDPLRKSTESETRGSPCLSCLTVTFMLVAGASAVSYNPDTLCAILHLDRSAFHPERWFSGKSTKERKHYCGVAGDAAIAPAHSQIENVEMWPQEKREWCCTYAGIGCPAVRQMPSFDCTAGAGLESTWSARQRAWCCAHSGVGCAYDCHRDFEKWHDSWPRAKQEWCCRRFGRGCPQKALATCGGAGPKQPAATSESSRRWCCLRFGKLCNTTAVYDCNAEWSGEWSQEKRDWCCQYRRVACGPPPLYECKYSDLSVVNLWSEKRRSWCCFHEHRACPVVSINMPEFDCTAGSHNPTDLWHPTKKKWCCQHYHRACVETTLEPPEQFDCGSDQKAWAPQQAKWCCTHEGIGCKPTYDCTVHVESLEQGWSVSQRTWCCTHRYVGCTTTSAITPSRSLLPASTTLLHTSATTSSPKFICEAGSLGKERTWSVTKKIWCCLHGGFGCAGTYSSTTTPPTTHIASPKPIVSCNLNCYGAGAKETQLPGSIGEGDGAAVHGLSMQKCRKTCYQNADCEGILYANATDKTQSLCYGRKHFHISKCQPGAPNQVTQVLKKMPWGQCAVVGDPHIITWDRVFQKDVVITDPGDYWLVRSKPLNIIGRFGFTDRFPTASSATGFAGTGPMINGHRLTVEYVGPAKGHNGFQVAWDDKRILANYPSAFSSSDGILRARAGAMNPSAFHPEGRHTIGGVEGDLPSYLFEFAPGLTIYVLTGPDNCNIVITTRKIGGGQDGYCGNFECNPDDDTISQLRRRRGMADRIPLNRSIFPDPPRAPRAIGAALHGEAAQD